MQINLAKLPVPPERVQASGVFTATIYSRNFGALGNSLHQRRVFVPFGGQYVRLRMIYEAPGTVASWDVAEHAVATPRQLDEINPKNADGTPVTWQSNSTTLTATAGGAGTYDVVETYSPWYTLYVLPDATYSDWGTIVMRSRNAVASAGRGRVHNGSNGKLNLMNNVSQRYKDFYEYAANTTAITSNNITLTSNTDLSDTVRNITGFQYEIETLQPTINICVAGDSRLQGEGSTSNLYSSFVRSVEQLWVEGYSVGYEFVGHQGTSHSAFHSNMMNRLSFTGRKLPDVAILQIGSTNGSTWTDTNIADDIARNMTFVSTCRALGVKPMFFTLHPSSTATTANGVANWRKLNESILASGAPVIDFYSRLELTDGASIPVLPQSNGITFDVGHLNDVGHLLMSSRVVTPAFKKIIGAV